MSVSTRSVAIALIPAVLFVLPASAAPGAPDAGPPSVPTAFFYGKDVPSELFAHYDRVVVEPDHVRSVPSSPRAEVFAYVSVGEVHPSRAWHKDVPKRLFLGRNDAWGSDVVDTRSREWATFLLDRVVEPLWARGYRGFFLDTLDSYERHTASAADRAEHARAIARIIVALQERHPSVKVVLNRGFDVLAHAPRVDGLVVESLFSTCDARGGGGCRPVAAAETEALLRRLREVRSRRRVPIAVIDYAPARDRAERRALARRIAELGFDPWVSTPALDEVGVGHVEIVPRRILLLYKSNSEGYLGVHDASVLIAPVLEWYGYAVDYADVRRPLPEGKLAGRYAGVVTLLPEGVDAKDPYRAWLLAQMSAGLRVAFVEGFGFDADARFLARLGLTPASPTAAGPVRIVSASAHFGFEAPARPRLHERPPVVAASADVRSLLRVTDAAGATWDGAVLGPWGGAAFMPYVIEERLEQERRWILDPFAFVRDALALEPIPAPDVTTEAGRRILTAHLDGDAFVSRVERPGAPFTAEVVLSEVLERHRIPHTVSIVEGEVGPTGMYPEHTEKLEAFARRIFALPHVEMASHTYSHPFEWEDAEAGRRGGHVPHLAIPGYTFDLQRDLAGSVAYIDKLAPRGKRVKVLLWSGNCSPSQRAVATSKELGLFNVNGGGSTRTRDLPSLTRGTAMGIPKGDGAYQVFAPVENENVYTNDWLGPFDGYRHAIETFELNDAPRRLGIISIYYHFYSAAKAASLRALEQVYAWALAQETTPLFLSEYAAKVLAFQEVSLARRVGSGAWELGGLGELRTVRADPALGWPDLAQSAGVAGVRDARQGRFVHLTDERERGVAVLAFGPSAPAGPRLVHANGRARRWHVREGGRASIRVAGNVPLELEIAGAAPCVLTVAGRRHTGTLQPAVAGGRFVTRFRLPATDTGEADVECR
ncbi:MAG: endo alpha-1,4 polygalactosaminidase [Labilithrix sp.]|nr:endo alpha-1,4 polygalactosaminidase [Labilithrix sp.]